MKHILYRQHLQKSHCRGVSSPSGSFPRNIKSDSIRGPEKFAFGDIPRQKMAFLIRLITWKVIDCWKSFVVPVLLLQPVSIPNLID